MGCKTFCSAPKSDHEFCANSWYILGIHGQSGQKMKRRSSSTLFCHKLVLLFLGALVSLSNSQGNWDGAIRLNENFYAHFYAYGDEQTGQIELSFLVNTTGYIGFGLSNHANMTDADIFIGCYFANNHTTYGKVL